MGIWRFDILNFKVRGVVRRYLCFFFLGPTFFFSFLLDREIRCSGRRVGTRLRVKDRRLFGLRRKSRTRARDPPAPARSPILGVIRGPRNLARIVKKTRRGVRQKKRSPTDFEIESRDPLASGSVLCRRRPPWPTRTKPGEKNPWRRKISEETAGRAGGARYEFLREWVAWVSREFRSRSRLLGFKTNDHRILWTLEGTRYLSIGRTQKSVLTVQYLKNGSVRPNRATDRKKGMSLKF